MQAFPKAKFILTIRNPEDWYQSIKRSTYTLYRKTPTNMVLWFGSRQNHMETLNALFNEPPNGMEKGLFQAIEGGPESAINFYNDWVEQVKKTIPEERLLIYHIGDGWVPLAEFLNQPIPNIPFPKENSMAASAKLVRNSRFNACFYAMMLILPPILVLIAFFLPEEMLMNFCNSTMVFFKNLPDLTMSYFDAGVKALINALPKYSWQMKMDLSDLTMNYYETAKSYIKGLPGYSQEFYQQMKDKIL